HDVGLLHDEEFVAVDLDFGARPLAEQHLVAFLDAHGLKLAVFAAGAGPGRDHLARLRLFRRGVGDDDPAFGLLLLLEPAHDHAIVQGFEFHGFCSANCAWKIKECAALALSRSECQASAGDTVASLLCQGRGTVTGPDLFYWACRRVNDTA